MSYYRDPVKRFITLPPAPEGWAWGPKSVDASGTYGADYLSTQHIQLIGPELLNPLPWNPDYKQPNEYAARLKKHSACCGIGVATYITAPPAPEVDKMTLLIQAIEEQNVTSLRGISMLTLSKYYTTFTPVLIQALEARGWKPAFEFANQVWHRGNVNNKVSLWFKDCTELILARKQEWGLVDE